MEREIRFGGMNVNYEYVSSERDCTKCGLGQCPDRNKVAVWI